MTQKIYIDRFAEAERLMRSQSEDWREFCRFNGYASYEARPGLVYKFKLYLERLRLTGKQA